MLSFVSMLEKLIFIVALHRPTIQSDVVLARQLFLKVKLQLWIHGKAGPQNGFVLTIIYLVFMPLLSRDNLTER